MIKKTPPKISGQDDRAGNGLQRIARLGTQSGRASNPTKLYRASTSPLPEAAARYTAKVKLVRVAVQSVAEEHQRHHGDDGRHGDRFDHQHGAGGDFYVAPGHPHRSGRRKLPPRLTVESSWPVTL